MIPRLALLALLVLLPTAVHAQSREVRHEVARLLDSGRDRLREGHPREALVDLRAAAALSASAEIEVEIARAERALGNINEAVLQLERTLAREGRLRPTRASIERLLAQWLSEAVSIRVDVRPDDARIYLDGRLVGRAPLGGPILATVGHHLLEVRLGGYRSISRMVSVEHGQSSGVEMALEDPSGETTHLVVSETMELAPDPATLVIESDPSGAQVVIDGDEPVEGPPPTTPHTLLIEPGRHTVELRLAATRRSVEIELAPRERRTLRVDLDESLAESPWLWGSLGACVVLAGGIVLAVMLWPAPERVTGTFDPPIVAALR
jgi:hypothetical protein